MKNDTVLIQQHQLVPTDSLVKAPMSRTLVYRTNREFDKCAELLRNILSVQESRRNSKSSIIGETNRKSQQQSQTSTRLKKQNSKSTIAKSSFIKTNTINSSEISERRSSYSPTKSLLSSTGTTATIEDQSLLKTRLSPNKSRKNQTRSSSSPQIVHQRVVSPIKSSPLTTNKLRQKSPLSPNRRRRRIQNPQELIRSSSCGDLPSTTLMHKQQTNFIIERLVTHLTRIRTISKQIRARNSNSINDPECYHLWNELESLLSSALSYAKNDIQFQLSLEPLRNEISELRKQLKTTSVHLREFDTRRTDETYTHLRKNKDPNQHQYSHLSLENQELKTKCDLLQEKIENLERNNTRLIQRSAQQDLRALAERTGWVSTDNRFLLREEILLLKQKLYHVYDDLATLFNRNHSLELSCGEQKQQLLLYKQQFNDLKQTAQHLLHDLDKKSTEDKVKRFLNYVTAEQQQSGIPSSTYHQAHITPTKVTSLGVNSSSFFMETPHKVTTAPPIQTSTTQTNTTPITPTNKLRPKSLFVTPTVLNDATALSKLQQNRSSTLDVTIHTPCSSSTIYDAESILTSSSSSTPLNHQQRKRTPLYNSLPTLNIPQTIALTTLNTTTVGCNQQFFHDNNLNNNESGPELDQISDLTSKMFSSEEEVEDDEDVGLGVSGTSNSSLSTIPSDAERLVQM